MFTPLLLLVIVIVLFFRIVIRRLLAGVLSFSPSVCDRHSKDRRTVILHNLGILVLFVLISSVRIDAGNFVGFCLAVVNVSLAAITRDSELNVQRNNQS
jgi:cadmium resistance protein CadD (predicted permease)